MPLIMLPKGVYVYLTEPCREAVVEEDGTFKPGRELRKGTVLQALEDFPNLKGRNRDLVRYRIARSVSPIVGAQGLDYKSDTRANKDDEVVLYMREVFQFLKTDSTFQEEVEEFEEDKKEGIVIAHDMDQAMNIFVRGKGPSLEIQ